MREKLWQAIKDQGWSELSHSKLEGARAARAGGIDTHGGIVKKIIFINRFFYPDISATSQLLTELSTLLSAQGQNIHIVTGRRLYDDKSRLLPKSETHQGVAIHRILTTTLGQYGLPGRAIDFIVFYLAATISLLFITRPGDILVAKTDPPMMSILVRVVGSLRRAKTINWLQDIFPEIAEQLGMLPRGYGIGNLIRGLRNWSLKYANANVVLGERMYKKLQTLGIPDNKIHIIHNWSNQNHIIPIPHHRNSLGKQWGLEGKFIVAYSGNMGRAHNFETILHAAKKLNKFDNIRFLWIGGGIKRKAVQQQARELGLSNFIFKGYQPREKLPESLGVADLHLAVLSPNLEGLIVPSKFYSAAAAGRPILFVGDENGELSTIIKAAGCGYSFTEGEGDKLAKSILYLSRHPDVVKKMGNNARKAFERQYGLDTAAEKWLTLFKTIKASPRESFISRSVSGAEKAQQARH